MNSGSNKTRTIYIKGMFCTNCEERVRKALTSLPGVKNVSVSYEKEIARVTYDPGVTNENAINKCIEKAGYETAATDRTYLRSLSVLLVLMAVWILAKHFGWTEIFNITPNIETSLSIWALFVTGLLTSVHCIAMCGGINLTQSVIASESKERLFRSNVLYQAGRILSYTFIGGVIGGIGQALSITNHMKGIIMTAAGCAIIIMGLNMAGIFKPLRRFSFHISGKLNSNLKTRHISNSSFVIGLLNGLMPCGPLQSMQIYALSTGSVLKGALSMMSFSLGTVPLMLGFGLVSGSLKRKYKRVMLTVSALVIFFMGLNMFQNVMSLFGISATAVEKADNAAVVTENGVQDLRTEIDYGKYPAVQVKAGIPVRWTIVVPEGKLTGCNREIIVPAFGLDIVLQEGENIVEFTADEPGIIPYSCWMGMIRNTIEVLE